jgi:hypothetical protein
MSPNRFDEASDDEFFAARIPGGAASFLARRAATLVQRTRAPASCDEVAAEDQAVAAFMDASGSLWTEQGRFGAPTHWLTAHCLWWLVGAGRHTRTSCTGKSR